MDDTQEKKTMRRGKRSPGYPMIGLEEAIQKAKILWDKEKNNSIPAEAASDHLGYKTIGGYAGRVFAAMKHFGLIYQKQNDIILTNEAVDLSLHEPSDDKYIETIKILALKPTIYDKLFNENSGQSDATLKIRLIKDYGFNPDKVNGFISDYRKTIEFANLNKSEIVEPKEETFPKEHKVRIDDKVPVKDAISVSKERQIATYTIGRGLTARILINGEQPTTKESIEKLLTRMQEDKDIMIESIADDKDDKNEAS